MRSIIVLAHNIRSIHNVGAILRTAEGFSIKKVVCSGYTPYPEIKNDTRLPHIYRKMTQAINKTALGAEKLVPIEYTNDAGDYCKDMIAAGYRIVGLEQSDRSVSLPTYQPPAKTVLLIGEEVEGLNDALMEVCEDIIEIPMTGRKESFNVSIATGVALYHLTNHK